MKIKNKKKMRKELSLLLTILTSTNSKQTGRRNAKKYGTGPRMV